eukprot:11748639-Ditylum_brightwellii.AAC.1
MGVATNNGGVASNDNNVAESSANTSVAAIDDANVSNPNLLRCVEVEASPENLMKKFCQDKVIHKIVEASNKYISN